MTRLIWECKCRSRVEVVDDVLAYLKALFNESPKESIPPTSVAKIIQLTREDSEIIEHLKRLDSIEDDTRVLWNLASTLVGMVAGGIIVMAIGAYS